MMNKEITIYTFPECPYCKELKELYDRDGDESKINIETHKAYIAGGDWMLEECKKALEKNGG